MSELAPYVMKDVVVTDRFIDPLAADVIIDPNHVPLEESNFGSPFVRLSHHHGRNVEDPSGLILLNQPITDENGDIYTKFTIKGSDASLPFLSFYEIEPNTVRVNGMLDASTFDRCQLASKILREAGVLTEWPIFHARPKQFPDGEGDTGLLSFKTMLYKNYLDLEKYIRSSDDHTKLDGPGKVGAVAAGLLEMKFGVMYRAMLSNARIREISEFKDQGMLGQHIGEAISALQIRKPEHLWCWTEIEALDSQSPEDQEKYLTKVLPKIMGENLARLHNAGAYHKYPHAGNWTLAGEIVDLDSVRHQLIDSEDASMITVTNRINEAADVMSHLYTHHPFRDIKGEKSPVRLFANSYFAERFLDNEIPKLEAVILESHFASPVEHLEDLGPPDFVVLDAEQKELSNKQILDWLESGTDLKDLLDKWVGAFGLLVEEQFNEFVVSQGVAILPDSISIQSIVNHECLKLFWQSYCELNSTQAA